MFIYMYTHTYICIYRSYNSSARLSVLKFFFFLLISIVAFLSIFSHDFFPSPAWVPFIKVFFYFK